MIVYWKYTSTEDSNRYSIYKRDTIRKREKCIYISDDNTDLVDWMGWSADNIREERNIGSAEYVTRISKAEAFLEMV